jgi:TonB family protein
MCRVTLPMSRFCILPLLFFAGLVYCQDEISVDAVATMHICGSKNPSHDAPCATAPRPVSKGNPIYPAKAREKGQQGTVTLGITVRKDGSVSGVHVVKSVDRDIDQAAMDAVSQWKFDPGTYEGKPVDTELMVEVNFRLSPSSPGNASPTVPTQGAADNAGQSRNLLSDAIEAYKRQDYATAASLLRRVTSMAPHNASAWNELGRALLAMNQLDAAVDAFKSAIGNDPASPDAYNNLGFAYWGKADYEDAAAQFRKQIVINPDDHYAHRNLGMMLRDQKKCSEAMPELAKALTITPNHVEALMAQGECDLDLGNRTKGISELQQATSISRDPGVLNDAAYALAERGVEIDMAEKWSEECLAIESARLQDISLEHLTAEQLNYVLWTANYWDTRGWIYFLRHDYASARSYTEASWLLRQDPTVADHLGQIYEKLGMKQEAQRTFAMAIALADQPGGARANAEDLSDANRRLQGVVEAGSDKRIASAHSELNAIRVISVPNSAVSGSADFTLLFTSENPPRVRQVAGDVAFAKFVPSLQSATFPVHIPKGEKVEIPVRGTLTCHSEEPQCHFALLNPEDAVTLIRTEMAAASVMPAPAAPDPHVYDNAAMGIRVSLPDEWKLIREQPGSFSQPRSALFGKAGATAFFMLMRERLEGSPELYKQMLESSYSKFDEYNRTGEESVSRDGVTGTRWYMRWKRNGIAYAGVTEFFSVGDDHYRITALAPKEVFDRHAEAFENMFHSVKFPLLRSDPEVLNHPK